MDEVARAAQRRATGGDPEAVARLLLARLRNGELTRQRIAMAAALGHEAARLTGIPRARPPAATPPTEAELAALSAAGDLASLHDTPQAQAAFDAAMFPLYRYERRVEAALKTLEAREQVVVATESVAHIEAHALSSMRAIVRASLELAKRWPALEDGEAGTLRRTLFDAARPTRPRTTKASRGRTVLHAAGDLVWALEGRRPDRSYLAQAMGSASRAADDEAAEVAWQTGRLCVRLLRLG